MKLQSPKNPHYILVALLIVIVATAALIAGSVSASRKSRPINREAGMLRRHGAPRTSSGPTIYLSESQPLTFRRAGERNVVAALEDGSAQPLSMATTDLDEDGVQDLIVGYGAGEAGIISLHRG